MLRHLHLIHAPGTQRSGRRALQRRRRLRRRHRKRRRRLRHRRHRGRDGAAPVILMPAIQLLRATLPGAQAILQRPHHLLHAIHPFLQGGPGVKPGRLRLFLHLHFQAPDVFFQIVQAPFNSAHLHLQFFRQPPEANGQFFDRTFRIPLLRVTLALRWSGWWVVARLLGAAFQPFTFLFHAVELLQQFLLQAFGSRGDLGDLRRGQLHQRKLRCWNGLGQNLRLQTIFQDFQLLPDEGSNLR
mmetsp:Transcript_23593/g.38350  ORF Transcript_23593/g.38350 Transcript_23593/m.38350 type:complete len:242 (-) Transcript_23593:327-1052(-)